MSSSYSSSRVCLIFIESRVCLFHFLISLLLIFSGSALIFASPETEQPEYVVTLDSSNFTDFVSKHKFIAVEFYAPWCGHCKKLAPEWEKAAKVLSQNDPPVILAKVDANEEHNKNLAAEHDVKGFPTIKILRFGGSIAQDYKGPREAQGIVDYFKKQSGPASAEIKSPEDAAAHINEKKITIVGVFPEFYGEKFENFTTLAERLRADIEFAHTTDAKLLPRGDSSVSGPIIRLLKPFDELFVDFQEFNVDVLEKLVEVSSTPLVTLFNKDPDNHPYVIKYFNSPNSKAMMFLNFSSHNFDAFKSKYRDVADQFKDQGVSFLIGDVEASQGAFQFFGLQEEQVPLVVIQTNNGQKYLNANVVPEQIPSLLKDFVDGKLQPYKKSEAIPQVNNEPVKVVVADNLDDMVLNSGKNVLLEFYAPWCGHCKKLAPILDEVAVSFQDESDVLVAKIDATANDYPHETFDVKGYPTLFFKSASGKISQYEGDRTKEDMINYIQKNKGKAAQQDSGKEEL